MQIASTASFLLFACILNPSSAATAQVNERVVFDFTDRNSAAQWQIVNDGVMGGRSTSQAVVNDNGQLRFSGTLSLENNGGFASVRSRSRQLNLKSGDQVVLRVFGDGRKYTFNLYVPQRRMAFSYRVEFKTEANKWMEIKLPLDQFVATSFGRVVRSQLDPTQVNSVGILLGDKKAGPFEILVDWIKVESSEN